MASNARRITMDSKLRILFVCRGNIYRSAIAEGILRQLAEDAGLKSIEVFSRGLQGFGETPEPPRFPNLCHYDAEWNASKDTLKELNVALEDHVATPLCPKDIERSDLIVAMSQDIHSELLRAFPSNQSKIRSFSEFEKGATTGIPDLEGETAPDKHRAAILRIRDGVALMFQSIKVQLGK